MLVFLAGVHGVGKDFVGTPVATRLGFARASASELIKQERGKITWDHTKKVDDLDANQLALISAVSRLKQTSNALLLDGHFALRDPQGKIQRLPVAIFERLGLAGVVVLTDDPNIVLKRLIVRDNHFTTTAEISELADAEVTQAHTVAATLRIPVEVIHAPSEDSLTECLNRIQLLHDAKGK